MNWKSLYYGHVSPSEVQEAVKDASWQKLRKAMKGRSLADKFTMLCAYRDHNALEFLSEREQRLVEVRLTNYVTALSRGGLIKPSDYR